MNVYAYYIQNLPEKNSIYYKEDNLNEIKKSPEIFEKLVKLEYLDDNQIINEWKKCLYPKSNNEKEDVVFENAKYFLLSYYLWTKAYYVKEFPHELESSHGLSYFSDHVLYKETKKIYGAVSNTVKWEHRRLLIDSLNILVNDNISSIEVEPVVASIITKISTRNANFEKMSIDEKLENIRNAYDYIINLYGGFDKINYSYIFSEYIVESNLKIYSRNLHAFRHGAPESLNERNSYTDDMKKYMVDFGIMILNRLCNYYLLINKS